MAASSRTTFEVWQKVIYDEALSRSLFDGSWRGLAEQRGFSADEVEVLAWMSSHPGFRWNIENLRFRTALETSAALIIHLPHTARLLTQGNEDWLQDTCYEYLAYHHWDALGHRRLTECERFADYCRHRIMRRRQFPQHLEHVLELELAVIDVHKQTARVPRDAWVEPPTLGDADLARARPRRGLAQRQLDQPVDLRPFLATEKATTVEVRPGPVTWLIHIPSLASNHKMKVIGEGPKELLARCTGERTTADIAAEMEAAFELPRAQVSQLVQTWIIDGILAI